MKQYDIDATLINYIEEKIIPRYRFFDKAHQEDHVRSVIDRAMDMSAYYEVNHNMLYAAAAYHDVGLCEGREEHHLASGRMIRVDSRLREWFSDDEIEVIAEAAEDHRASATGEPRSIYGRIVAEADRLIIPEKVLRRTVQFGLSHYPELPKEGHWERTVEHLHEKYAEGGYLRLWIPESDNARNLAALRDIIRDKSLLRKYFDSIYAEETV